jgi:hypothetical protein
MNSHEKSFAVNVLKTAGIVVLMVGFAIAIDVISAELIELGIWKAREALINRCSHT